MAANILVSAFAPFPSLSLAVPSLTPVSSMFPLLEEKYPLFPLDSLHPLTHSGAALIDDAPLSALLNELHLTPHLLGGRRGLGPQLRMAVGRGLPEYLGAELERAAEKAEAQKAKLEALECKLGIIRTNTPGQSELTPLAGKKHRFEDTECLQQSKEYQGLVIEFEKGEDICIEIMTTKEYMQSL
ncbi:uncharacterized protein ARMOST_12212 [Armillaria ostoyae]|uniref:Sde2 ubiquitin domain-containing protein n=1 Tax=Armillaria ostoyae TaxID=47428 RepID=A0A284RJ95_ARMOS|nr:uncharacterized protein ARMOST_12212 [Armillaria ostoyae]